MTESEAKSKLYRAQCAADRTSRIRGAADEYKYDCPGCGGSFAADEMTLDHEVPATSEIGGRKDNFNQMLMCKPCNVKKGARLTLYGLCEYHSKHNTMVNWHVADDVLRRIRAVRDHHGGTSRLQRGSEISHSDHCRHTTPEMKEEFDAKQKE